jgi:hypothetical protein
MRPDEFWQAAMQPELGDTMAFETSREDDGQFFSMRAYEDLALQIQRFVMARHYAAAEAAKGKAPSKMRVLVSVAWDNEPVKDYGPPWYTAADPGEGMAVMEGDRRMKGADDDEEGR